MTRYYVEEALPSDPGNLLGSVYYRADLISALGICDEIFNNKGQSDHRNALKRHTSASMLGKPNQGRKPIDHGHQHNNSLERDVRKNQTRHAKKIALHKIYSQNPSKSKISKPSVLLIRQLKKDKPGKAQSQIRRQRPQSPRLRQTRATTTRSGRQSWKPERWIPNKW